MYPQMQERFCTEFGFPNCKSPRDGGNRVSPADDQLSRGDRDLPVGHQCPQHCGDNVRHPASERFWWDEAGAGNHRAQPERDRSTRLLMQQSRVRPSGSSALEGFVMMRVALNRSAPSAVLVNPVDRTSIFPAIAEVWRELRKGFLDTYRPELHYMRGPGPKWREKHGAPKTTQSGAVVRTLRGASARTVPVAT